VTDVCIAGCGPAGAVLALLLARAGVDVLVLEKHADFLRDFRGDTIHPSTLEILDEIGLAERVLALPHTKAPVLHLRTPGGPPALVEDLSRLPTKFPYIAFVPQWHFLDLLTAEAVRYPTFRLIRSAEAVALRWEDGVVRGVRYRDADGERDADALLTVGCDGRGSPTRSAAGLRLEETSPPMDVLWFRLSRRPADPPQSAGVLGCGCFVALINRTDYWQVAYVIPKGADARVRAAGLDAFRAQVAEAVPEMADRVGEIASWDDVKLLTVQSNRLERWWQPGYLAIGDAAHAMSPIGGVGINLAIQDAVAAANLLVEPLRRARLSTRDLAAVQRRREWPTRVVQLGQAVIQSKVLAPTLRSTGPPSVPGPLRALLGLPWVRDLPARAIGLGVRREHVAPGLRAAAIQPRPVGF
jgi:2-polyprenyl-6-methoxyphenol hydroxylase-like FAD-dependent oxidoreductase